MREVSGIERYSRIFNSDFSKLKESEIKSTGYVVDTLEAALWCVLTTGSYRDCVLKAVNLGDDTDTVAAIAGGLAGAIYGYDGIPKEWRDTLIKRDYIEEMCERAGRVWGSGIAPGTPFEELPEDFECPVCGLGKTVFKKIAFEQEE